MIATRRRIAADATALAVAGAVLVGLVGLAGPASAADDLIAVEPGRVTVEVPAPGHADMWEMTARNVTDATVPLSLEVSGAAGTVFAGEHPLDVTVSGPGGEELLDGADVVAALAGAAGAGATVVGLPDLAPGAEYVVRGRAAMPAEAGDEYRGASGDVTFRFVATQGSSEIPGPGKPTPTPPGPGTPTPGPDGPTGAAPGDPAGSGPDGTAPDASLPNRVLAWTGANPTAAFAVAAALIGGGATFVVSARRRRSA